MKNWKIEVKLADNEDSTITVSDISVWPHAVVRATQKDFEMFSLSLLDSAKAKGTQNIEQVDATSIREETISLMLLTDIAKTRFDMLEREGCKCIWDFNKAFPDMAMLPVIVCFHDMDGILANEVMAKTLLHMLQTTRAVGIHIVILDEIGSNKALPSAVIDNCPVRITIVDRNMEIEAPQGVDFLKINGAGNGRSGEA